MNKIKLYMFAIIFVLFAAINGISATLFGRNLIRDLSFNNENIYYIIYAIICMSILYVGLDRDTYIRPLGMTFIPSSMFNEYKQDKTDQTITIEIDDPKANKIIYWAAKPSGIVSENPKDAYGDYANYGIAKVINGKATLYFNCPGKYVVNHFGIGKLLDKHIHYRIVHGDGAIISSIKTVRVSC